MAFIDYYKIMGIKKDTPQGEIRSAYLRRTKQFHPDLHADDPKAEAKFKALQEAYAVLSDPEKRALYNRYGEHWKEMSEAAAAGGGGASGRAYAGGDRFAGSFGGEEFSSFFDNLFGHGPGGARSWGAGFGGRGGQGFEDPRAADLHATVGIDLYTALLGGDVLLAAPAGRLRLHVRPETQNGAMVRLKGKGRVRADGSRGDLIVTYSVTLPQHLSERQKELLREMRAS